ncbi:hypothetical protein MD484_g794, partial [Candolleomyces efflorescens]
MWYNLETPETALTRVGTIIKFYDLPPGLSIDYAKIIGNEGSPLITVPVMADDSDKQITYSGSWTETQEPFTLAGKSQVASASAYGGGVHVGRQVGDTVELRFQGNAIKVFGLILPGDEVRVEFCWLKLYFEFVFLAPLLFVLVVICWRFATGPRDGVDAELRAVLLRDDRRRRVPFAPDKHHVRTLLVK